MVDRSPGKPAFVDPRTAAVLVASVAALRERAAVLRGTASLLEPYRATPKGEREG